MTLNIKSAVKDTLDCIKHLNDNSVLNDIVDNINEELKPGYSLSYTTIYDKYEFNLNYKLTQLYNPLNSEPLFHKIDS